MRVDANRAGLAEIHARGFVRFYDARAQVGGQRGGASKVTGCCCVGCGGRARDTAAAQAAMQVRA